MTLMPQIIHLLNKYHIFCDDFIIKILVSQCLAAQLTNICWLQYQIKDYYLESRVIYINRIWCMEHNELKCGGKHAFLLHLSSTYEKTAVYPHCNKNLLGPFILFYSGNIPLMLEINVQYPLNITCN